MPNIREELIKSIMAQLNMVQDAFAIGSIKNKISKVPDEKLEDFYDALFGEEHAYLKPLDRVSKVAKRFDDAKKEDLLSGTRELATNMYNKFLSQNNEMLEYCRRSRAKVPSDREFFINLDYKNLKNVLGENVYTDKELYVLEKMGGGDFLLNITHYITSASVIEKIESIINSVITKKYLTTNANAIENKRTKVMIGRIA